MKWYRDGGVYRAGSTLIPSVDRSAPRYGDPDADKNPVKVNNSDGSLALKAIAGEDAKELAKHEATLVISGNTASHGGGIGANGGVIIGEPGDTQLSVNKEWAGDKGQERPESTVVELLNGGYVIDSAVLNAENNWSYTFTGLPAGGDYSVREAEKSRATSPR
ncbi:MAG TPA: Cna B-type domain-containing protein [Candidatus Scatomorpha stercoravium]|nr:Cna B-type domain-containing protein [Candidatus Scatomorpha stercoravium]